MRVAVGTLWKQGVGLFKSALTRAFITGRLYSEERIVASFGGKSAYVSAKVFSPSS